MKVSAFDHIVLCVRDVYASLDFYENVLGMTRYEERPGKWSLHFGQNKISLQNIDTAPAMAKHTKAGSGNFCLLTDDDVSEFAKHLEALGIDILEGPSEKIGAVSQILSVYFRDPDLNLIEVSNRL